MPLTNQQYDAIMRGYDRRQYQNYRLQCARQDEIYKKIPRIRSLDERISSCSLAHAEQLISLQDAEPEHDRREILTGLKERLDALRQEKEALLLESGYPADYLDMHYTCPDCRDTGYVGGRKCRC